MARLSAAFLDWIFVIVGIIPFVIVLALFGQDDASAFNILLNVLLLVPVWLYFVLQESGSKGATFGKRIFNLRVVNVDKENQVSLWRATTRCVGRAFFLGFIVQPFTLKKQALHDILSRTVVVYADADKAVRSRSKVIEIVLASLIVIFLGLSVWKGVIPAYQLHSMREKVAESMLVLIKATESIDRYFQNSGKIPTSLSETGWTSTLPEYADTLIFNQPAGELILKLKPVSGSKPSIILSSAVRGNQVEWSCRYLNIQREAFRGWESCKHVVANER